MMKKKCSAIRIAAHYHVVPWAEAVSKHSWSEDPFKYVRARQTQIGVFYKSGYFTNTSKYPPHQTTNKHHDFLYHSPCVYGFLRPIPVLFSLSTFLAEVLKLVRIIKPIPRFFTAPDASGILDLWRWTQPLKTAFWFIFLGFLYGFYPNFVLPFVQVRQGLCLVAI